MEQVVCDGGGVLGNWSLRDSLGCWGASGRVRATCWGLKARGSRVGWGRGVAGSQRFVSVFARSPVY